MLELVVAPDDFLKKPCRDITPEEFKAGSADGLNLVQFANDLVIAMKHYRGIGLAAPQVRVGLRVFAINTEKKSLVVFNPTITEISGSYLSDEGCLSIPGVSGTVRRHRSLRLRGFGPTGLRIDVKLEKLMAAVAQHEFDHLDGVLFVDKAINGSLTQGQ
jgi:peptide deformylase